MGGQAGRERSGDEEREGVGRQGRARCRGARGAGVDASWMRGRAGRQGEGAVQGRAGAVQGKGRNARVDAVQGWTRVGRAQAGAGA
jgi:hypothetical protein